MVKGLLACAGIRTAIFNEYAPGAMGDLPLTEVHPEIWVDDERDLRLARQIIQEYELRDPAMHVSDCRTCGEENPAGFELCWNCGKIL